MRAILLASTALAILATPTIVFAQSNASTDTAQPAEQGLIEVIITAQRKKENLQKAGIPVDVISSDTLIKNDVSSVLNLSKTVPSLSVQSGGGANMVFFLRGVGNFTVNGYSDPAMAFNYDDVYLGRPTSTSGMFYDLERLEVLKGPQGTLYGRNATAGAINVVPAKPKLHLMSGNIVASVGDYGATNLQGAINVPIGDIMALRLSGNVAKHDGYMTDGTGDEDSKGARLQFLIQPNSDFSVRLNLDTSRNDGMGAGSNYAGSYAFNFATQGYTFTPSGLDTQTGLFDPASQAYRQTLFSGLAGRTLTPLTMKPYLKNSFTGFDAHIDWTTAAGTLSIIPAVRSADLDNLFAVPAFYGWINEKDRQSSLEVRFNGTRIGMFDYTLGAYYYDETVAGHYNFAQQALNAYQDFDSKTKSTAVFARVTANLSPKFRVITGVRYTDDQKSFVGQADVFLVKCLLTNPYGVPSCPTATLLPITHDYNQLPAPFIIPPPNGATPIGTSGALLIRATTPVDSALSNDKITYHIGAEYDLAARSLLYASFETGFRSGGFALSAGHETFEPEYIDAYTIGMKNRLLDNNLQLNLEAFLWKYRNQQVNHTGVDINGNQGQFTENVGRSTNAGIELDGQYLPFENTLLSANVQYLDAHYDDFKYEQPNLGLPPNVGCPFAINPTNPGLYTIDCSGKPTYQSPKWTVNLGVQQTFPIGNHQIVASFDTQYKSSRYTGFEYLDTSKVDPNWTSNFQIGFGDRAAVWAITAYVRNIENARTVTATQYYNAANAITYITTAPRTYGVRLTRSF